ncbi:MAG TPA: pseudouridine synthase, partial [Kofleriaceae bacterium]|nr:pseudouridine synthase [Kofleriaceae bacterium]
MHTVRATAPVRLVDYAKAHLVAVPVGEIGGAIARGALAVNGHPGRIAELVRDGDVITLSDDVLGASAILPPRVPRVIRHEDEAILVCDKPAGMHVHPLGQHRTHTLLDALSWYAGARPDNPWAHWRPRPLHRLDRAASGLVAFAKHAAVHDHVRRQFAEHAIAR